MPTRRLWLLTLLAIALGLLGGAAAWLLVHLIDLFTAIALFGEVTLHPPPMESLEPGPRVIIVAMFGALAVSLLALWAPAIRGHGIPETMEAVLTRQSRVSPRVALAKPLSAALSIGTGGPFGAEGPIIVTGGSLGSLSGQVLPVSPSERKILLASGAAAGMAATFGAPLASVVLAFELLLFEFSATTLIPIATAAAVAAGVHVIVLGEGPLFALPAHEFLGLQTLPYFAGLGLLCGLLAALIAKGLFVVEHGFRALPVHDFWHPVIGAVGFASVGLVVPRALGVGYDAIGDVLTGDLTGTTLAALFVAKLLAWWIALGSGTSGGTLAPLLLIGGAFGALAGTGLEELIPGIAVTPGQFALVAMAATFGASTRATFASVIFLFELTRDYDIILPLLLATVLANLVGSYLMRESLMTEKLSRRGLRIIGHYEPDVLHATTVAEVMSFPVHVVADSVLVGEARAVFRNGPHSAYPVVDGAGRCVGMLSRTDLLAADVPDSAQARAIASADVITVRPGDSLDSVLAIIAAERIEHLPVIGEEGSIAGICTRTDLLKAYERRAEHEQAEAPPIRLPKRR